MTKQVTDAVKALIALGIGLANEMIESAQITFANNSELIRAVLVEAIAIDPANVARAFKECDERLEKEGYRSLMSEERARARRIAAGVADPEVCAKVLPMLEAGTKLQEIAAECPKLSNRGRPAGKGAGKSTKSEPTDESAPSGGLTVQAVIDFLKTNATQADRLSIMRTAAAAYAAGIVPAEEKLDLMACTVAMGKLGTVCLPSVNAEVTKH